MVRMYVLSILKAKVLETPEMTQNVQHVGWDVVLDICIEYKVNIWAQEWEPFISQDGYMDRWQDNNYDYAMMRGVKWGIRQAIP